VQKILRRSQSQQGLLVVFIVAAQVQAGVIKNVHFAFNALVFLAFLTP